MRDPSLDEARARQRRALRTVDDGSFSYWLPSRGGDTSPPKGDHWFAEVALRRAADELFGPLAVFFNAVAAVAYADTATVVIKAFKPKISFEQVLTSLAQTRSQAIAVLESLRVDDSIGRWIHLVVWADELADDGYRDHRIP